MKKIIASLLLAAAPACSFASIITYDFTVTGGTDGPLAGTRSDGYFSFNDNSLTPPGRGSLERMGLLTALSFNWLGTQWDETTANTGWINLDASGSVAFWNFGTQCYPGLCRVRPEQTGWFIGASGVTNGGFILYSVGDGERVYEGGFTSSLRPTDIPEPSTLALFGASVLSAALVWSRRRVLARLHLLYDAKATSSNPTRFSRTA